MAKGRVVIDEMRCKGCTLCTTACPQHVLVMDNEHLTSRGYHPATYLAAEARCTGCGLCAVMCPDVCITVYREVSRPARARSAATQAG